MKQDNDEPASVVAAYNEVTVLLFATSILGLLALRLVTGAALLVGVLMRYVCRS